MQPGQPNVTVTLIVLGAFVLLMALRMRKMTKERPLKLKWLWVRPIYVLAVGGLLLFVAPPAAGDLAWLAASALAGGVIGWYWGRTTGIHIHPENGTLMTKSSRLAMMVLLLLIAVRLGLRTVLQLEGLSQNFINDVFVAFAVGLLGLQTLEIFLRSRRVLRESVKA